MTITVVFDPPLPSDSPATFNTKAFTLLGDLNDWSTEANALAATVTADEVALAAAVSSASTSAGNALTSANNAAASFDSFDDRYLGAKSSAPTLDNDGGALLTGALYFNSTSNTMFVYTGSVWAATNANFAAPGPIGGTTPAAGSFTTGAFGDVVQITGGTGVTAANGIHTWFNTTLNRGYISAFHSGVDNRDLTLDAKTLTVTTPAGDRAVFSNTGLSVTGTLSATTNTEIAASQARVSGTDATLYQFTNTGGTYTMGVDRATGGYFGSAYAFGINAPTGRSIRNLINSTLISEVSSTGLSVTGALSTTGTPTFDTNVGYIGKTGSGLGGNWRYKNDAGTYSWLTGILGSPGAVNFVLYDIVNGKAALQILPNPAEVNITTTGLDVVGTIASKAAGGPSFDASTATASSIYVNQQNTSGRAIFGVEGSAGGSLSTNATPYSAVIGSFANQKVHLVTNGDVKATLDASGNWGLGVTPAAAAKLQVKAASNINFAIANQTTITGAVTLEAIDDTRGSNIPMEIRGTQVVITRGAGETARFDASGNFGLGVTPSASLHIAKQTTALSGSGQAYGAYLYPDTGGRIYLDSLTSGAGNTSLSLRTYINGTYNTVLGNTSGGATVFGCSGTNVISIAQGTTLALEGATSAAGTGIAFPATQLASSNANTLDDYEEGTWTPTIVGTSTAGVGTYSVQVGTYTKVGRMVNFKCYVVWSAHTGTGNMIVGGLPFASSATANTFSPITVYVDGGLSLTASNIAQGYIGVSSGSIALTQYATGGGSPSAMPLDTAAQIMLSGYYEI